MSGISVKHNHIPHGLRNETNKLVYIIEYCCFNLNVHLRVLSFQSVMIQIMHNRTERGTPPLMTLVRTCLGLGVTAM